ncbi:hypothetical protein F5148DRAFT_234996 [Russula earlei]|uniref:Uncharacterized protein n=1 Tax=Russula earlei TaxID=71964 RepID=A0ACC0U404_9AGAM|nr:hypothetical protein F5148DRAFT_234996 [Russula earlei]
MDVVKESLNVAGLLTNVYARPDLREKRSSGPVVALFFLHGRRTVRRCRRPACARGVRLGGREAGLFEAETPGIHSGVLRTWRPRGFLSVSETIRVQDDRSRRRRRRRGPRYVQDQRNHGERTVDERGNLGWSLKAERHNERYAVDMYGMIVGAVKDVSFLIEVLPTFLFPNDERTIDEWVLAGFSLGGHATWLALRHEPRIRIGISICGCPEYLALMEQHAKRLGGISLTPPRIPASLRALVRAHEAASEPPAAVFAGKRVLVMAIEDDPLVPWAASRAFVEALDVGRGGRKEVAVEPGERHEITGGMRERMFRFFWEEALVVGGANVRERERSAL